MKTRYLWMLAVSVLLATTNSSAQDSENSNPYAIFGRTPYVAGAKDAGADGEKVFVIENFAEGSKVARIEHNPQMGRVRLLNKHGKLLKEKLLKACENGWPTQDRFAEKYYSISPYAFCAGNPIRYIDIKGDSINVAAIISYDANNGTNYLQTIMNDLSSQTGLTYSVSSTGMLVYQTDSEGKAVVATDANGNQLGSTTARNLMTSAIGVTETVFGSIHTGYNGSGGGGSSLVLNPNQIGDFITGANEVDSRTQGFGMTFMHELSHTTVGGGLSDSPYGAGNPGPVETRMNRIRSELNAQGGNYGQRVSYEAVSAPGGVAYIPFSPGAHAALLNERPVVTHPHIMMRTIYRSWGRR